MANYYLTGFLQLAILFILKQYSSLAQTTGAEEPDRILKKRGDDAWFLEKSAWPPMPYDFGYEVRDLEGNEQYRNEQSDGNRVTGSYGYFGPDGIYRHVDYTADERGFRAQVRTSEPGVAAQNPANVKIITEPLLPQRTPVPGGRILRPIETSGIFDPSIIGDPVLEKGLTYIRDDGRGPSSSGMSTSSGESDDVPMRRPTPNIRGVTGGGVAPRPSTGGTSGNGANRQSYNNAREAIAAGRDPSIVTRDPSAFAGGIDDILGIGGRGITIPIGQPKAVVPSRNPQTMMDSVGKTREDSPIIVVGSRSRGSMGSSLPSGSRNAGIDDLIRNRELLERERELAAREQSLLERERNSNRASGVKGGSSYRQISIPAHEFVKRRDSSSKQQHDAAMSDASTIDNKEPTDSTSELVKKNGSTSESPSVNSSSKEENSSGVAGTISTKEADRDSNLHASVNAIESMLMSKNGKKTPVRVYLSDGPMKGNTASVIMNSAAIGNERERETSINTGGMKDDEETSTRKPFDSTDQQISHLKFDDESDKIAKYRLKPQPQRNAAYLRSYNNQYRYPIEETASTGAIQLKRSYPKNYQQYRLLRSRLPRERPSTRTSNKKLTGLTKELVSSPTKDDKTSASSSSLINENGQEAQSTTKESLGRLRIGRILSSKIISLKDNEQIASTQTNTKTTDQRINFRSELLPKVNIAYNNLIRRSGLLGDHQASNQQSNELTEQSKSQMYIQRYSNQTAVSRSNSSPNLKHLNDAILLTNVSLIRNVDSKNVSSHQPTIQQNAILSSDASSIQETTQTLPTSNRFLPINATELLLEKRTGNHRNKNSTHSYKHSSDDLTTANLSNELPNNLSNDSVNDLKSANDLKEEEEIESEISEANDSSKIFKSSMLSPLELQLIKMTQL